MKRHFVAIVGVFGGSFILCGQDSVLQTAEQTALKRLKIPHLSANATKN